MSHEMSPAGGAPSARDPLRQIDTHFRAVQEASPDGFQLCESVHDAAGRVVDFTYRYMNPAGLRLVGRSESEMLGRRMLEVFPGLIGTELFEAYLRVAETGEPLQREVVYTADGLDGGFRVTGVRVGDGIALTFGDVTARLRAEAARTASENRFRAVFEHAAVGMARVGFSDARWLEVNDAFCRMLGYTRHELLATPWPAITHSEDIDLDLIPFRQMAAGELESYVVEKRFLHQAGHHVRARLTLSLVRDEAGLPDYEIAVIEDISERHATERALAEREARYRALLESVDVGFSVVEMCYDSDGRPVDYRFLETNPAFVAQTGLADVVGRTAREVVPGIEAHWVEMYGRVAATGEAARFQSGSERMGRWFDVYATRVGRPDDRQVALVFTDVSAARAAEQERERLLAAERTARERTEQLQSLTAALSEAVRPGDVVHVAVEQGLRALGADAGLVALLDASGEFLTLAEARGYSANLPAGWHRIPYDAPMPVAEAVRTGRAVVLGSREERERRFPAVAAPLAEYEATLALPLIGQSGVIGALAVNRRCVGDLGGEALTFMNAFARQCAQALERARLHEAAERSRREVEEAAAALARERAKLATVIESLPVGVGTATADGYILSMNRAGLALHGFASEAEMLARLPDYVREFELLSPDGRVLPVDEWPMSRAGRGEPVRGQEVRLRHSATGVERVVSYDVVLADVGSAGALHVYVIQDLTDARRAASALAERTALAERREAELAAVLDRLPAAVWITDADGGVERVNAATAQLYGAAPLLASTGEYVQYEAYWPAGHPRAGERLDSHDWALARTLMTGESVLNEALEIVRFGTGERRQVLNSSAATRDASGQITGGVVVMFDVTEQEATRRDLESARAEAEEERRRLAMILDRLPVGVVVVDATGAVVHVNAATDSVLGTSLRPVGGLDDYSAYGGGLHPDGRPYAPEDYPIARAALYGEVVHQELTRYRRGDGREVMVSISAAPVRDAGGRITYAVAAVEDVSERETVRAAAVEANRAKSQFLANMSHELRTPLNAIQGHVQLIEMGIHGPVTSAQAAALERVQKAQRHLLGLITDVLNYAKLEAGRVEFDVRETLVADVIGDVLPLIEPQVRAKGLDLVVSLPEDLALGAAPLRVWADREKLTQVLLNLLANAAKFTPATRTDGSVGRITVELAAATKQDDLAELRVCDTGIGIPEERQATIFDPFVQVNPALTREHEGAGLGLAISRDLARGMGAELHVRSVEGGGSTFTVTLRRVETAAGERSGMPG